MKLTAKESAIVLEALWSRYREPRIAANKMVAELKRGVSITEQGFKNLKHDIEALRGVYNTKKKVFEDMEKEKDELCIFDTIDNRIQELCEHEKLLKDLDYIPCSLSQGEDEEYGEGVYCLPGFVSSETLEF